MHFLVVVTLEGMAFLVGEDTSVRDQDQRINPRITFCRFVLVKDLVRPQHPLEFSGKIHQFGNQK